MARGAGRSREDTMTTIAITADAATQFRKAAEEKMQEHERAMAAPGGYQHPYDGADEVLDTDMDVQRHDRTAHELLAAAEIVDLHLSGAIDVAKQTALSRVLDDNRWALAS